MKHGLLVRPKESETTAVVEDVCNQIIQRNALKDKHFAKHRIQTALKSFTYSYLDLDSKQFLNDQNHINTIQQLRNKCMILKPDKGQGVVLIDKIDYYNSMERIFNDKTKFKVVNNDPTFRNLASVQNYLNTLVSRGELIENDKMEMRPKSARLGRAHGLPKIHKDYTNIFSFRPIVNTTCTVYYGVGKYLSNLLNSLTLNEYSLKDSFEATQRIHSIPTELFAQVHFTLDTFDGGDIHFLDLKIEGIETDVYHKPTHTGQYFDFTSQRPWNLKTAWVKALVNRAKKICSIPQNFNRQLYKIKKFMAWNNYPIYIVKAFLKRQLKDKPEKQPEPHDLIKICLKVPYLRKQGEQLVTMLVRKFHRYLKPNIKLIKFFNTKKASMFCPTKDKVTKEQKANVIYKIICPGCNNVYVGKTDRCFGIRMNEHGTRSDQPMHQHLTNCKAFQETVNINALPELFNDSKQIDHKAHVLHGVLNNCDFIDSNDNWSQLCFLEAFYITKLSPSINNGLKASKELQLFC